MKIDGRKPQRHKHFDYNTNGLYFITICTKPRQPYFGTIKNGIICLNQSGAIAYDTWRTIPNRWDNIFLKQFIVMPDHIHGLIVINKTASREHIVCVPRNSGVPRNKGQMRSGPYVHNYESARRQSQLIPKIVGQFKRITTKKIRLFDRHIEFGWQKSYHDQIIGSEQHLINVQKYINENPKMHLTYGTHRMCSS